jgi:hypothetical protein
MMEEYKNQESAKQEDYRQEDLITSSQELEKADGSLAVTNDRPNRSTSESTEPATLNSSDGLLPVESNNETTTSQVEEVVYSSATCELNSSSLFLNTTLMPVQGSPIDLSSNTISNVSSGRTSNTLTNPDPVSTQATPSQRIESNGQSVKALIPSSEKSEPASPSMSPTTQESVYKTITKRLSLLEANATLSLRYIEEQSQILRDVFSRMERRHSQRVDSFISELNSTLIARLEFFVSFSSF